MVTFADRKRRTRHDPCHQEFIARGNGSFIISSSEAIRILVLTYVYFLRFRVLLKREKFLASSSCMDTSGLAGKRKDRRSIGVSFKWK